MPRWQKADVRCVEGGIHNEIDGLLMYRFGEDIPKLTNIRVEHRESFRSGDNRQIDNRGFRAVCENSSGYRGFIRGQEFGVEDYLECAFFIRLDDIRPCDFSVTASRLNPLDVKCGSTYISCCQRLCYRTLPFWERSEVNLLLRDGRVPLEMPADC